MRAPLVSVLVPTRGRPAALLRALASVQAQTLDDWEAVVVDDGDGEAVETAATLADPRVRALPCAGRGLADARSTGAVAAHGAVLAWLDDDDLWLDARHLAAVAAALAPHGRAGGTRRRVAHRGGWLLRDDAIREEFDWPADAASLRRDNTVLTSSIAYPRALHREIGLLDRSVGGYCDWDLLLRALDAGWELVRLPGLGVGYAVHDGAASAVVDRPERRACFERFRAKHGLAVEIKSHALLHAELAGAAPRVEPAPAGAAPRATPAPGGAAGA